MTALFEGKWDLQSIADCLQRRDKRLEFLEATDESFEKAISKNYALRKCPTPDAHWVLWMDCMKEPARTFFSLQSTSKRNDVKTRFSLLRRKLVSEQARRREEMGKFWDTYGHLGDYSEQHLHTGEIEFAIVSMDETGRRSSKNVTGIRLCSALDKGRSHQVHRLTQLLGGRGIGVRKRLFFHLPGSPPDREDITTHVTKPGAMEGMDAEVVDIGETDREFQADMPPLEPMDMNMLRRARSILFCTAKQLAKGNRRRAAPRWSAPAELFLMCASPSYLSVGPRRLEGIGVEEIMKKAKMCTRAKRELVVVLVHAQRAVLKRHHG